MGQSLEALFLGDLQEAVSAVPVKLRLSSPPVLPNPCSPNCHLASATLRLAALSSQSL